MFYDNAFYLPITMGPDPKFSLDKNFWFEIDFDKLKDSYLDIVHKIEFNL